VKPRLDLELEASMGTLPLFRTTSMNDAPREGPNTRP
jgi:hypothetical protein